MRRFATVPAALLAALALAGCGGEDEASPPETTSTQHTTETATQTTETTTEPAGVPATIRIEVRDGRTVGGLARPEVEEGARVQLVLAADVSGDVHLHGYDLEARVTPSRPARLRFTATIPGRFEIELHARPELHVGELTVRP
ncbi:MAG TPA: hypothetical protein VNJ53_03695 [Gaiellaceae bacterium]|nr:hypothetical protein [Gaiellaceae bacterium]